MNKNLNEAIVAAERSDALLFAIESCFLDFDILPEELEKAKNRGSAYLLRTLGCSPIRKD
jgi:hypothetical protein